MNNNNCVFCKIVEKELPSNIVWEDDEVLAFLTIGPVTKGHTLVIPKKHYQDTFDIPEELLCKINKVSKLLGESYLKILNSDGANFLNASGKEAQQSVFHYHMHVIPRYASENLNLWFHEEPRKTTQEELNKIRDDILKGL